MEAGVDLDSIGARPSQRVQHFYHLSEIDSRRGNVVIFLRRKIYFERVDVMGLEVDNPDEDSNHEEVTQKLTEAYDDSKRQEVQGPKSRVSKDQKYISDREA